jgi:hypothetical protein
MSGTPGVPTAIPPVPAIEPVTKSESKKASKPPGGQMRRPRTPLVIFSCVPLHRLGCHR